MIAESCLKDVQKHLRVKITIILLGYWDNPLITYTGETSS